MKNTILTEREKNLICRAATDIESGNYLICPRSYSELAMVDEVLATINTPEEKRSDRQKEIMEYYHQCTDYDYWNSLPDDEKLF
jgi:hypothetical protein